MTLRRLLLILVPIALCAPSASGWAADPPMQQNDANLQRARELFAKGSALANQNKYEQARKFFEQAWNLKKNPQTATGLGWGELNTDQFRLSAQHLAYAVRINAPSDDPDDLKFTMSLYDKAKARVATVKLRGVEPDAIVIVDSQARDPMFQPDPVFLEPGSHTIQIRHADGSNKTRTVNAEAGSTIDLDMTPDLVVRPPASAMPSASVTASTIASARPTTPPAASTHPGAYETSTGRWSARTWTLVGESTLAAAAIGVGIGFALHASSLSGDASSAKAALGPRSACRVPSPQCNDLSTIYDDRNTAANWAKVGFVTGGVFAVAAAATFLLWPKSNATDSASFTVSPIVGHATGVGVHATF